MLILMQWKKKGKQTSKQRAQHQTLICLFFLFCKVPTTAKNHSSRKGKNSKPKARLERRKHCRGVSSWMKFSGIQFYQSQVTLCLKMLWHFPGFAISRCSPRWVSQAAQVITALLSTSPLRAGWSQNVGSRFACRFGLVWDALRGLCSGELPQHCPPWPWEWDCCWFNFQVQITGMLWRK